MSATGSSHTFVLIQFTQDENSKTYLDFDTIQEALDGICQIYEQKLRLTNKRADDEQVNYDLADLLNYIDKCTDMSCLTYNDTQKVYVPHGREWIKSKIYMSLKRQAK